MNQPDSMRDLPVGPYHQTIRLSSLRAGGGQAEATLTIDQPHLRSLQIAHGGLLASLLDTATGLAASADLGDDCYAVTAQLNCNYVRPAWAGETLVARGHVVHRGRRTAVTQGEIRTLEGALVATASATILFLPHTDQTRGAIQRRPEE